MHRYRAYRNILATWTILIQGGYWTAKITMLSLASISIAVFVVVASMRLIYPFELEWIEGGYMDYVRWIATGNALYPPPSLAFIPANKTPLFMVLSAGLTPLTGINFVAPRLLSILATLGCFALLFVLVWHQTRSIGGGLTAAGLYAAAFYLTGTWMDIARPDSLCLFFVLLSFWVAQQHGNHLKGMLISGLCGLLAYYTKQIALPIMLVVAGYSLLSTRGATWLAWTLTALSGMFVFFLLDMLSDGWFSFYTFDRIAQKQWVPDIWRVWWILLEHAWPLLLLGLLVLVHALAITRHRWSHDDNDPPAANRLPPVWGYLALAGGLLGSSWSVFLQVWTYTNGLMPVMLGLCLLAGLAVGETDRWHFTWSAQFAPVLRILVLLLVLWQFMLLTYDPRVLVPTKQDRLAGQQFVAYLSRLPGDVLVYHHGYFAYLAGKPSYFHSSFFGDALGSCIDEPAPQEGINARQCEQVRQMWVYLFTHQPFDQVIVDKRPENWLPYYLPSERLFDPDSTVFYPVTGAPARPTHLLRRNPLVYGGTVHFADPHIDYLTARGLSVREEWGRWSDAPQVTLEIALEQQDYELALTAFPFCHATFDQQIMVYWNQHFLGTYTYETCDSQIATFKLPGTSITSGMDEMRIELAYTTTPSAMGGADDNRQLGLGFVSLSLEKLP